MAYTGPSFSLHVKITIAPENVQKFLDAAEVAFGLLADEPELTFFQMYQSADEPGVFKWVENWNATREWFLTVQIQKEYYKPYMAATEPLFIKPREVEFYERMQGKTWNVYKEGSA